MIYEFQVLYRVRESGQAGTIVMQAETAPEAAARLPSDQFEVLNVGPGRAVIDWTQPVFNKSEAAAYLRCSESQVDLFMAQGVLPKAKNGWPRFRRAELEAVIEKRMEKAA
ncbi:MAG: helix-turn-helix domain-containing protein [Verrucomicrobiota bacterium]